MNKGMPIGALQEDTAGMRNQKKRRSGYRRSSDWQRYLRILALPLVVVILILVIVLTDRGANTDGGPTEEVQQSQTNAGDGTEISAEGTEEQPGAEMDGTGETGEGETAEIETAEGETGSGEADPAAADGSAEDAAEDGQDGLRRSDIPEITALMEEYCAAKVSCDAEAMYRIYGRTDMTGVEELEQRMQWRVYLISQRTTALSCSVSMRCSSGPQMLSGKAIIWRQRPHFSTAVLRLWQRAPQRWAWTGSPRRWTGSWEALQSWSWERRSNWKISGRSLQTIQG